MFPNTLIPALCDRRLTRCDLRVFGELCQNLDAVDFDRIDFEELASRCEESVASVLLSLAQLIAYRYVDSQPATGGYRLFYNLGYAIPLGSGPSRPLLQPVPVAIRIPEVALGGTFRVIMDGGWSLLGEVVYGLVDPRDPERIRYAGRTTQLLSLGCGNTSPRALLVLDTGSPSSPRRA